MDSQRRKTDVNLIWVGHLGVFLHISYMCAYSTQVRFILIKRNFWTKTEIGFVKEREAQILKERSEAQKSYPNAPADLFLGILVVTFTLYLT